MSQFHLDRLADNPFLKSPDADATLRQYRQSKPDSYEAYVIWEPFVSKILENPEMHVVIDSSRFRGYIVDVIVANRDYLAKNADVVQEILGCYFRAVHEQRNSMVDLVLDDGRRQSQPLTTEQATRLVEGIRWKNTQDNFSHFGAQANGPTQHIEDMIGNIMTVMLRTRAIPSDPTAGQVNRLYYDQLLRQLKDGNFHPGLEEETATKDIELPALTDSEWSNLRQVGKLPAPPLVFARGTTKLTPASLAALDELVKNLSNMPQFYVLVKGNATRGGDLEADKAIAKNRAQAVVEYLLQRGVQRQRVRAVSTEPNGNATVTFVVGVPPY
jgi:outer membrane protein OmpA-like peptidoglycan-associated protein